MPIPVIVTVSDEADDPACIDRNNTAFETLAQEYNALATTNIVRPEISTTITMGDTKFIHTPPFSQAKRIAYFGEWQTAFDFRTEYEISTRGYSEALIAHEIDEIPKEGLEL